LQARQIECTDDNKDNKKAGKSKNDIDAKNNRKQPPIKHTAILKTIERAHKCRRSVNKQYMGLVEAVLRFQTETSKRFRQVRTKATRLHIVPPLDAAYAIW